MSATTRDHELFEQAERARKQGEFDIAQRYAEALLRVNPHHVRGTELLRQIKVERAQRGLPLGERMSMAVSAFLKVLRGKYEDAIPDLELLYRRDPKKLAPAVKYAKACLKAGKYKLAVEPLEDAHRHHFKNRLAAELLAETYRKVERYEDAVKMLQMLRENAPGRTEYYTRLIKDASAEHQTWQMKQETLTKARSDQEREKREKEAKLVEKARIQELIKECAANPDNIDLKVELVNMLIDTEQYANAARVMEPICRNTKNVEHLEKLALLYERTYNYEGLADAYKRLQQVSNEPGKYESNLVRARLELTRQRLAEAPTNSALREHVEKLEKQLREIQIHDLRVQKRQNPGKPDIVLMLARVLRADGRTDEAIREYQELSQIPSYAFVASHELGRCFLDKGMDNLGTERLEAALTRLPSTRGAMPEPAKQILYTLGEFYISRGEREKGLNYWKTLYDADIDYRDIQTRYELAYQGEDIGPLQDFHKRQPPRPKAAVPREAATEQADSEPLVPPAETSEEEEASEAGSTASPE